MEARVEVLDVRPVLCLPDFLRESKAALPGAEETRELASCCRQWPHLLNCLRVAFSAGEETKIPGLLFIFLPESVERLVAEAWRRSLSQGYLLHNLAQKLCREALELILPQVGVAGCAPVPCLARAEEDALRQALGAHDKPASETAMALSARLPGLGLAYSLLTYYPYLGQCACCALSETCPKLRHS